MIPKPSKTKLEEGFFYITEDTKISFEKELLPIVEYFRKIVSNSTDFRLESANATIKNNVIRLVLDKTLSYLSFEGYSLHITADKIEIKSAKPQGIFYALQSVRQLLPPEIENGIKIDFDELKIPCIRIEDAPRFKWRGFMFDVGRHFHPVNVIKQYLDIMALLKMNVFHWHLTEDQGWRVRIKKYPKLTEIGSKRIDSKIGGWISKKYRGKPHEGFYSQNEIREVINFASERFIKVIPEIEMPGHSSAAIASYPELSCKKKKIEVPTKFGIFTDVFCVGQEQTYEFLRNVLDEIIELFPSDIIHIGGDEVRKTNWKECSECQHKLHENNMKDTSELHRYFIKRIGEYISSKGKIMMGWNEILNENIKSDTIGQYWSLTGKKNVFKHLEKGGTIVISNFFKYYLDYSYLMTPLKKTYQFEPIPQKLNKEKHNQILGVEAPIWTEWVPNSERLAWQVFPRLAAVAETGWTTKENKNYADFKIRLRDFNKRLDMLGIKYAPLNIVDPSRLTRFLKARRVLKWPEV